MTTYILPPSLQRHIRENVLGHNFWTTHWQNLPCDISTVLHQQAFNFWMSGQQNEPFEEISRQEITLYNASGNEVGFVLQEGHFMTTWCRGSRREGGETVADALARLGEDVAAAVKFIVVVFYGHQKMKSVKVWCVRE